jgi:hypothetical protein
MYDSSWRGGFCFGIAGWNSPSIAVEPSEYWWVDIFNELLIAGSKGLASWVMS